MREKRTERERSEKKISILVIILILLLLLCLGYGGYYIATSVFETEKPETEVLVTFELDGGTLLEANKNQFIVLSDGTVMKLVKNSKVYGLLPQVQKTDLKFDGWYTTNDETGVRVDDYTKLISENAHTLYARYTDLKYAYKVLYKELGTEQELASTVEDIIKKGEEVTAEQKVVPGYSLVEDESELSKSILADNTTLTLYYEKNTYNIKYTVNIAGVKTTSDLITTFKFGDAVVIESLQDIIADDATFNRLGYTFDYWQIKGRFLDDEASFTATADDLFSLGFSLNFEEQQIDTIELLATYTQNDYTLTFYNGNSVVDTQELHYNDTAFIPDDPSKDGYVFAGWFTEPTGTTGTNIAENTEVDLGTFRMPLENEVLYAGYTLEQYDLVIDLKGGAFSESVVSKFTVEDYIVLPIPSKSGYHFSGFVENIVDIPILNYVIQNRIGDLNLIAMYYTIDYNIYLDLQGGNIQGGETIPYNKESSNITLGIPNKDGYEFIGWTTIGQDTPQMTVTITTGNIGDKWYTANFVAIKYNITYDLGNGSITDGENPVLYTIESENITLINPSLDAYNFIGWTRGESTVKNLTEVITTGTMGDLTFTAHYEPIEYTIKLNVKGGQYDGSTTIRYTVESDAITLADATKKGYTFTGWTSEEITTPTKALVVASGSTGNKNFTANYTAIDYTITYDYNGGTPMQYGDYKTSYNIESATYTPSDAQMTGYVFAYWELRDENGELINGQSIVKGSTGNRTYKAFFIADTETIYTVNHYTENLDGTNLLESTQKFVGETETQVTPDVNSYDGFTSPEPKEITISADGLTVVNYYYTRNSYDVIVNAGNFIETIPTASYKFEEPVHLQAVVQTGYKFLGWSGESENGQKFGTDALDIYFNMPSGDVTFTISAEEIGYSITLNYNDNGTTQNKIIPYNYFSNDITIEVPTRSGYTFLGWSGSDIGLGEVETNVVVRKNSQGDKEFTANWEIITYNINYILDGQPLVTNNPTSYDVESESFILENPTKEGYTFVGWSGTGLNGSNNLKVTIAKGSTGDKEFTAHFEANEVSFVVKHNIMNLDGLTYSEHIVNELTAKTDEWVTPAVEQLRGFTAPATQTKQIKADGTTEFIYEYTRNKYELTVNKADVGIAEVTGGGSIFFGANVEITATLNDGYDFVGWSGYLNETKMSLNILMPDSNVDLIATSALHYYNITYDFNEGSYDLTLLPQTYTVISSEIIIDAEPTRVGYDFIGWSGTDLTAPTKSITITTGSLGDRSYKANYKPIDYGITYDLGDGVLSLANPRIYTIESGDIVLNNPTLIGYTFTGWSGTDLDGENNMEVIIPSGSLEDRSYTAHYQANKYIVTLDYNNATTGVAESEREVTFDSAYGELPTLTRTGYTFEGWYMQEDMSRQITADTIVKTPYEHTIVAKFLGMPYTITFNKQAGQGGSDSVIAHYDSPLPTEVTAPTKLGYLFKGYYERPNATGQIYYDENMVGQKTYDTNADITIYAYWQLKQYEVTLDMQNGINGTELVNPWWNRAMPEATAPTRVGYTFGGYFTAQNGGGTQYYTDAMASANNWSIDSDTTLYAKWTANRYTVTFDRYYSYEPSDRYDTSVGTVEAEVVYDSAMPLATAPYIIGKVFMGYYDNIEGAGNKYYDADMNGQRLWQVPSDETLYAYYTIRYYTITLDLQNGTGGTTSIITTYGNAMPTATAPTRVGYTFGGYYKQQNGAGTQYYSNTMESVTNWDTDAEITLYAKWAPNNYTITLNGNGGTPATQTLTAIYDQNLPDGELPVYHGYTFHGFTMQSEGMEIVMYDANMVGQMIWTYTEAKEFTAKWTRDVYTITFDHRTSELVGGFTYGTTSATVGYTDALPTATAPVAQNYWFRGYYSQANGNGTKYYDENMVAQRNYDQYKGITSGADGNLTLYAYWTPKEINLDVQNTTTYYYINGSLYSRPSTYYYQCSTCSSYVTSAGGNSSNYCSRVWVEGYWDDYWDDCGSCTNGTKTQDCSSCDGGSINEYSTCQICWGDGTYEKWISCSTCSGSGNCTSCGGSGGFQMTRPDGSKGGIAGCSSCGGTTGSMVTGGGSYGSGNCGSCGGSGGSETPSVTCTNCDGTGDMVIGSTDCTACDGGTITVTCTSCGGDGGSWEDYYVDAHYNYYSHSITTSSSYRYYRYEKAYGSGSTYVYAKTSTSYSTGYYWNDVYGAMKLDTIIPYSDGYNYIVTEIVYVSGTTYRITAKIYEG
ncbi:MAG: InlB B-repeat-containing protein [Clostridia bacterium]|nr:InlB B-repeat-containing protein [Clostridia bacterium]